MTSYVTPRKNVAHKFYVALVDQSNTKLTKANPTIASGDFKVSTDGGAFANLATLPSANPASGRAVMIDLSSGEMNGDNIVVQCVDAAGAEWCDLLINIQTSARQIDDLAYPATSGRSIVVDAAGLVDSNVVKVGPTGSGTAQTAGDIMADTNDIQTRLPAALVSGRMDCSVGAMAANVLTATAINADAITAAKVADGTIDAATFAAGAINAAAIAADAITDAKVASDVTIASVTGAVGSVTGNLGGNVTGSVGSIAAGGIAAASFAAGAINAAAIATDAIDGDAIAASAVTEIQTGMATSTAVATLQTSVDDLPTNAELATALGTADDAVLAQVALVKAKTDNLPTDPADESLIIAATDAIMARIGAPVGASISADVAAVQTDTDNIQTRLPTSLVSGRMDSSVGAMAANTLTASALASDAVTEIQTGLPTAAENADAVWDELLSGHAISGSAGAGLSAAGAAGDPWSTPLPGAYGAGTAGKIVGDNLDAPVSGIAAAVWAVSVRTLSSFGTLAADAAAAVWAAVTRTLTAGTNIVLAKGVGVTGFNDLSAAQINAEADTALADVGLTATITGRIDVATSTRLASASYTAPDNTGIGIAAAAAVAAATDTGTLLGRLTSGRASNLDFLDAAVTSRAAAGDAMALTAGERGEVADKLLGRSLAGGADGGRTVRDALRSGRNKKAIVGSTLTVYAEDDTTAAWTATIATAPGDPLTAIDPDV